MVTAPIKRRPAKGAVTPTEEVAPVLPDKGDFSFFSGTPKTKAYHKSSKAKRPKEKPLAIRSSLPVQEESGGIIPACSFLEEVCKGYHHTRAK